MTDQFHTHAPWRSDPLRVSGRPDHETGSPPDRVLAAEKQLRLALHTLEEIDAATDHDEYADVTVDPDLLTTMERTLENVRECYSLVAGDAWCREEARRDDADESGGAA